MSGAQCPDKEGNEPRNRTPLKPPRPLRLSHLLLNVRDKGEKPEDERYGEANVLDTYPFFEWAEESLDSCNEL